MSEQDPKESGGGAPKQRRKMISQADIPSMPIGQALRVPRAIADDYAKSPVRPIDVAASLEMSPTSGPFRMLCGAALGYGLTAGGPNAAQIALTELGRRVVAPLEEGDDLRAMREAVLTPTVSKEFLQKYDGSQLPADRIAANVLESLGVPPDRASAVYDLILMNADSVGFTKTIKDRTYIDLGSPSSSAPTGSEPEAAPSGASSAVQAEDDPQGGIETTGAGTSGAEARPPARALPDDMANRRVFITHGKQLRVVDQLKELLAFGDFEPVVSVERESLSKPVPDKVMEDMRSCSAGIIHVDAERRLLDQEGVEHTVINQNVLIEIGAAMALYKGRFILLVANGTELPSNLQGLYQVRYEGEDLGYEATLKVLKALNEFKGKKD